MLNFCLQADALVSFTPVALLWPCYGLIALTFLFFAVSLLLFISAACSQFTGGDFEVEPEQTLTCTTSTAFFLNASFFMAFSIVGFMVLLSIVKDGLVLKSAIIGLAVSALVCVLYIGCQMKTITA